MITSTPAGQPRPTLQRRWCPRPRASSLTCLDASRARLPPSPPPPSPLPPPSPSSPLPPPPPPPDSLPRENRDPYSPSPSMISGTSDGRARRVSWPRQRRRSAVTAASWSARAWSASACRGRPWREPRAWGTVAPVIRWPGITTSRDQAARLWPSPPPCCRLALISSLRSPATASPPRPRRGRSRRRRSGISPAPVTYLTCGRGGQAPAARCSARRSGGLQQGPVTPACSPWSRPPATR